MADQHEQTNVRVPTQAKPTLSRLARMLRDDPGFLRRLIRFLDEESNPDTASFLSLRVERLERQVSEITTALHEGRPIDPPRQETEPSPGRTTVPRWTTGEGRGRRLTPEGETELRRLSEEGWTNGRIAARLGIKPYAVSRKRQAEQE